ncbi:NACHT and WD repeat domain-containing protein [Roseibacillus persicicus]|uniref:NACHT and WD repeat domain-containing protein n=1 Tax=Roseibacillus persicicus TaxID=454148 RepID=UPI00280C81F5|nr:hypothetical protein [Roseibacillus persicicus]MDQ8192353.1 hypothetical protein [Roseibacillus persicicus]
MTNIPPLGPGLKAFANFFLEAETLDDLSADNNIRRIEVSKTYAPSHLPGWLLMARHFLWLDDSETALVGLRQMKQAVSYIWNAAHLQPLAEEATLQIQLAKRLLELREEEPTSLLQILQEEMPALEQDQAFLIRLLVALRPDLPASVLQENNSEACEITMPILFVNQSDQQGDPAKLTIRTSPYKGTGTLIPALNMSLIARDETWLTMENNVRQYLAQEEIWPRSSTQDLEWSVALVKGRDIGGFLLFGGSAGVTFALAISSLVEANPSLKPRFICNLAFSATLQANGKIGKVSGVESKLNSLQNAYTPKIQAAGFADEAFTPLLNSQNPDDWRPFPKELLRGAEELPSEFLMQSTDDTTMSLINLGSSFGELLRRVRIFQNSVYWDGNPYQGLNFFTTEHSPIFFGRETETKEIESLFEAREQNPDDGCSFIAIIGASGSGKSSLARAGYAASLLKPLPNKAHHSTWYLVAISPSELDEHYELSLLRHILMAIHLEVIPETLTTLAKDLSTSPEHFFSKTLNGLQTESDPQPTHSHKFLFLIDQFEELTTHELWKKNPSLTANFLDFLNLLACSGSCRVLVTTRLDYDSLLESISAYQRLTSAQHCRLLLHPPRAESLRAIITRPAQAASASFEVDPKNPEINLSDRLIADIDQQSKALPLLQFTLASLYENCRDPQHPNHPVCLTNEVYEQQIGGIEGSINRHAEATYKDLCEKHGQDSIRTHFETIFSRLIQTKTTSGEADKGWTSAAKTKAELTSEETIEAVRDDILSHFENSRLLEQRTSASSSKDATFLLLHDSIITGWSRLQELAQKIEQYQPTIRQLELALTNASKEIELLPKGTLLTNANQLLDQKQGAAYLLPPKTINFINRSTHRVKLKRRTRNILISVSVFILAVSATVSFIQWKKNSKIVLALSYSNKETHEALTQSENNEGKAWLERANLASERGEVFKAALMAGKAIGFEGFTNSGEVTKYKSFLQPSEGSKKRKAQQIIQWSLPSTPLLIWRTPNDKHHKDEITSVAINRDRSILASSSLDGKIILWNLSTGEKHGELSTERTDPILTIDFHPTQNILAAGSSNEKIYLWDYEKLKAIHPPLRGHTGAVTGLKFNHSGDYLFTGSEKGKLYKWNTRTKKIQNIISLPESNWRIPHKISNLNFSENDSLVATYHSNSTSLSSKRETKHRVIYLEKNRDKHSEGPFFEKESKIIGSIFEAENQIHTITENGTIHSWNPKSEKKQITTTRTNIENISDISLSSKKNQIIISSTSQNLSAWSISNKEMTYTTPISPSEGITCIAIDEKKGSIFTGNYGGEIKKWENSENSIKEVRTLEIKQEKQPNNATDTTIINDLENRTFTIRTNEKLKIIPYGEKLSLWNSLIPERKILISLSSMGTLQCWDTATGKILRNSNFLNENVKYWLPLINITTEPFYDPNQSRIIFATDLPVNGVFLCNTNSSNADIFIPNTFSEKITSIDISPDGRILAWAHSDKSLRFWDIVDEEPMDIEIINMASLVTSLTFSPDGKTLVISGEKIPLTFIDWRTKIILGNELTTPAEFSHNPTFSKDGKTVTTYSILPNKSNFKAIWRTPTVFFNKITGHSKAVNGITFSPDGSTLASVSDDKTLRIWDAYSGLPLANPLENHQDRLTEVAFTAQGEAIIVAERDNKNREKRVGISGIQVGGGPERSQIYVRNGRTFEDLSKPLECHGINSMQITANGKTLVFADAEDSVGSYHFDRKFLTYKQNYTSGIDIEKIFLDSKKQKVWSFYRDGKILIFDVNLKSNQTDSEISYAGEITSVAVHPTNNIFCYASEDNVIRFRNLETGKFLGPEISGHTDTVTDLAFSPNGKILASVSRDLSLRFWDCESGLSLGYPLYGHNDTINDLAFHPNGRLLATASSDSTIGIWNVPNNSDIDLESYLTSDFYKLDGNTISQPTSRELFSQTSYPEVNWPEMSLRNAVSSEKRIRILLEANNWPALLYELDATEDTISEGLLASVTQALLATAGHDWKNNNPRREQIFPRIKNVISESILKTGKLDHAVLGLVYNAAQISDPILRDQYWPQTLNYIKISESESLLTRTFDVLEPKKGDSASLRAWKRNKIASLMRIVRANAPAVREAAEHENSPQDLRKETPDLRDY